MEFTRNTNNIWFSNQVEPVYDPQDEEVMAVFNTYWLREQDRCMNGFYLADGQVFIPGRLYFHTVYGSIAAYNTKIVNGKEKKIRGLITPLLRDIDWMIFNDLEYCSEEGLFYALVGSRDFGKSVIAASCAAWQYTFFPKSESVISGGESKYIKLATDKIEDMLTNIHPIFRKQRLTSDWNKEIVAGYKDKTTGLADESSHFASIKVRNYENGTKSMAANGTRPGFHLIDEIGTIQYLISCVKDSDGCWWSGEGNKPSCLVMLAGTGGNAEKGAEAGEIFFHPEEYGFLSFDNTESGGKMGRFISALQVKLAYKDEQSLGDYLGINHPDLNAIKILVSNEERAKAEWWDAEHAKAQKSGNPKTLLKFKAYWPTKPSHCFLVTSKNMFNTEAASIQKQKLDVSELKGFPVRIFNDGDGLRHEFIDKLPISEFPLKTQDPDAPIIMYEPPIKNAPKGLYVAGVDPYTHDESEESESLGSVYIFKRIHSLTGEKFQDMFVASYTARPVSQRDWWDNARNLIKYYNAIAVVENDQPSFIHEMITKKEEMYLMETPRWVQTDIQQTSATFKRPYGLSMAPPKIRNFVFGMLKNYLDEEIVIERAEDGTPIKTMLGVQKILDPMLLEEIIKFNVGVNTDRVIAAALAIAVASKLDPVYGVVGEGDSRTKQLYQISPKHGMFLTNKTTFSKPKKLFR